MPVRLGRFEMPKRLTKEDATATDTFAKFIAEPFETGYGHTIGNSLRRVLLSSLEGAAVTSIKIDGAMHEFTTIDGVVEDVTDIVLNVKSLVVKNASEQQRTIRIDRHEKGVVSGKDIITDEAVQMHGAMGVTQDVPLARMWTGLRTLRLADGPDAVHRRQVARAELKRYTNQKI